MSTRPLNILSLGAGVQSSTMALMAAHGELTPMPDAAIFADTGAEPSHVYEWLDWLEQHLPFPVHRVMEADGIEKNIMRSVNGQRFAGAPFFTESGSGVGRLKRQCTNEFKVQPIRKKVRALLGLRKGERGGKAIRAIQWIGMSMDEAHRMKPSRDKYIQTIWPLIDKRMSRYDCLNWMERKGYPQPTKSSCYFCPYHSNALWREYQQHYPEEFQKAVVMDRLVRGGVRGTKEKLYLHRSLTPLEDVDLRNAEDFGQADMFGDECEGMCGV